MSGLIEGFQERVSAAATLVEALPYLQKFRGKTIVIKYGGSAMEEPSLVESVLRDVVFLEVVGINPVVVHGGGKAITRKLSEVGVDAKFINGLRVTDNATIKVVDDVLHKEVNPNIVKRINEWGGYARSYSGRQVMRVCKAEPIGENGEVIDLGFVGEVLSCDVVDLKMAVGHEIVPVVSPVGEDEKGQAYNVNADTATSAIAKALKADRVVYLSDVNGVLQDPPDAATRIPTIQEREVDGLIGKGVISGGMIPKVNSALEVLHAGAEKVHMIDGRIPHALLLELFTDKGIGTEIIL